MRLFGMFRFRIDSLLTLKKLEYRSQNLELEF